MYCHYTYLLRMGQSFMKWPILPQMRQQRSFGATSPSVRTSGSKKYSCGEWRQITFLMLNNSNTKFANVAENTYHLAGVHRRKGCDWRAKHCSAIDESLHDEVSHCLWKRKRIYLKRKDDKGNMTTEDRKETHMIVLFLDRPAPRLWFRSNGSVIQTEEKATQIKQAALKKSF